MDIFPPKGGVLEVFLGAARSVAGKRIPYMVLLDTPMHADVRWGKIGWSLYSGVLIPRLNQKCRVSVRRGMSLTDQTGGSIESSGVPGIFIYLRS